MRAVAPLAAVLVCVSALRLAGRAPRPRTFVQRLRGVHVLAAREEDAVGEMVEPGGREAGTVVAGAARSDHERFRPVDDRDDAETRSRERLRRLTRAVHRVLADERRALPGRGTD